MKKLMKLLTAFALMGMLLGCELTLKPIEKDKNEIVITNNTERLIKEAYFISKTDYKDFDNDFDWARSYYSTKTKNLLSGGTLAPNKTITVDFADYTGTEFYLISFEEYTFWYETVITSTMTTASIHK